MSKYFINILVLISNCIIGYAQNTTTKLDSLKEGRNFFYDIKDASQVPSDSVLGLQLREKGYRVFPEEILKYKNLKYLDVSMNQFKILSPRISELNKLQVLIISYGSLSKLPREIGNLKSLKELTLIASKVRSLPKSIGNLSNLELLNLSGCGISYLPKTLYKLQNLKVLALGSMGEKTKSPFSEREKRIIRAELPNTKIIF